LNSHVTSAPETVTHQLSLEPGDSRRLANLNGLLGQHLRQIEERLDIEIRHRGTDFELIGPADTTRAAAELLRNLYQLTEHAELTPDEVHLALQTSGIEQLMQQLDQTDAPAFPSTEKGVPAKDTDGDEGITLIRTKKCTIKPRGLNQQRYVRAVQKHDINFGIGPAGTGITYLAVAMAISALMTKRVNRIILARPAVEAGERLGFLPGTLQEKIDPYLRPLYDALLDMLPYDKLAKFMERSVIEIAPLGFMRGRTLANAFVILDEAQNASENQMKMFLTRMGRGAKFIVTGDTSQVDLPRHIPSGLLQAIDLLEGVKGIGMVRLDKRDVIRHKLVENIIERYDTVVKKDHNH